MKKFLILLASLYIGLANAGITEAGIAANTDPLCKNVAPFYWEIGDANGKIGGGSVGTTYVQTTKMDIASASKWIYGAYVVQKNRVDVPYLNFTSGYVTFDQCIGMTRPTVYKCSVKNNNEILTPSAIGKFYYSGAHMQMHAASTGLGPLGLTQLATEIGSVVKYPTLKYTTIQLAGGVNTSASEYAAFLRNILNGSLLIKDKLGSNAVLTQGDTALNSPTGNNWSYSLGHWVEYPQGDGAYSSTGTFGFYPWIDKNKTTYGVLARKSITGAGDRSAACGAAIRKAYFQ